MENNKVSINQWYVSNPDRTRKFVCAFNYKPVNDYSPTEQISFLMEIEYQLVPSAEEIIWAKDFYQELADFIKEKYYQEAQPYSDVYNRFENFLQSLNKLFAEAELKDKNINLLISVVDKQNIHFAQIGKMIAYLCQNKNLIPLVENEGMTNKVKRFSNIISGVLENDDQVFFATTNLFEYLPKAKLDKSVKTKNEVSLKSINASLKNLADQISLGLIVIKNKPVPPAAPTAPALEPKKETEKKSTAEKPKAEKKSESVLTKKPLPAKSKSKAKLSADSIKYDDETLKELVIGTKLEQLDRPPKKSIFIYLKKAGNLLIKFFIWLVKKTQLPLGWRRVKNKFSQFSYLQRALIVLFFIIAIALVEALVIANRQEYSKQANQKNSLLMQQIQDKEKDIAAALIYKDKTKARSLLNEANDLLKQLPQTTPSQKQAYQNAQQELNQQLAKTYNLQTVTNVKIIADLSKTDNQIKVGGLAKLDGQLYVFNPTNNFIYQINLADNKVSLVNKSSVNVGYLKKITSLDKDSVIFSHSNNGLAVFNVTNKTFNSLELDTANQNLTIGDLLIYADKLYILDNKNSQIYKYIRTAGGFGKEGVWLKTPVNLQTALSFAADGAIYVLSENGQLLKFYLGTKQQFSLEPIFPALLKPIKISAWLNSKYIYVLEPLNKRLVIFNKNGGLVKQLISDQFTNLTDFVVNDKEDVAWLLNDKTIFEIPLK